MGEVIVILDPSVYLGWYILANVSIGGHSPYLLTVGLISSTFSMYGYFLFRFFWSFLSFFYWDIRRSTIGNYIELRLAFLTHRSWILLTFIIGGHLNVLSLLIFINLAFLACITIGFSWNEYVRLPKKVHSLFSGGIKQWCNRPFCRVLFEIFCIYINLLYKSCFVYNLKLKNWFLK